MTKTNESVLQESIKKRKGGRRLIISIISGILFLGLSGTAWHYFGTTNTQETVPETVTVEKKNLRSVVSSDGHIMNPNIVNLSFLVNGTIDEIFVEEGARIKKGEILAGLDTREFEFDLKSATSDVSISWANIKLKQADLTDTELITAENDLISNQASYDSTQRDVDQKVTQAFDLAFVEIETSVPEVEMALQEVDQILLIDKNYTGGSMITSVMNDSLGKNIAKNQYEELRRELDLYQEYANGFSSQEITERLQIVITLSKSTKTLLDQMIALIKGAHATGTVSISDINSARATIVTSLGQINKQIASLTKAKQNIDSSLLAQKNNVIDAEHKLQSSQVKLENSQKVYEKLKTTKSANISIQYAQLEQAKLRVEKAEYNLELATLIAPINGEIIQVNGNEGEAIKGDTTSSENAFIKILSDSNFTTEVYVEEIDIAQVHIGQKVDITLDAIENLKLEGTVTFISSTSTTDSNGIVTYLVRIDILDTENSPIREGMTTYIDFVLGSVENALAVPIQSVRKNKVVIMADGSRREVVTGFSDGIYIEIKEGLKLGDIILKTLEERTGDGSGGRREMTPERLEQLKGAGFTDGEIEKMSAGEFTDEMKEKMQIMREQSGSTGRSGMGMGMGMSKGH
jgi:HlyD family secretion protein